MSAARTPKPIKTAQRVLYGLCPLADILGLEPEAMEPWAEWLFAPAVILADLADPTSRPHLSPALARRALAEASGEASARAGRAGRRWPGAFPSPARPALYGRQRGACRPGRRLAGRSRQFK